MEILEKIYLTVYLLSISIFLHYGNGGKIFFCKRIRIFFFKKIRREKLLISEKYMVAIKRYPWKGNVRELKNTVKRCLVVTEGEILDYQSLPLQMLELSENTGNNIGLDLASVEKHHIQKVLQHTNGYKPEAARLLGICLLYTSPSPRDRG